MRNVLSTAPVQLPCVSHAGREQRLNLAESFGLPSGAGAELGGAIWPAAALMCRWLASERENIAGARVIELGSGTGACGLYAAALGAKHVTLTDGGGPALLRLLEANIETNQHLFASDCRVNTHRLFWGDIEDSCLAAADVDETHYDYVLAADVLYGIGEADAAADAVARGAALAATMEALLLCSSAAARPPRVIVAYEHRCRELRGSLPWDAGDEVLENFFGALARRGLGVQEVASERPRLLSSSSGVNLFSADLVLFEVLAAS